jgi:hypothetical protein
MSPYISDIYKSLGFVPQPSLRGLFRALFKGEGGVDHARFGHDDNHFAAGFAKVIRAAQNAELRRDPSSLFPARKSARSPLWGEPHMPQVRQRLNILSKRAVSWIPRYKLTCIRRHF